MWDTLYLYIIHTRLDYAFKGTNVNQVLSSLHGVSFEFTLTVPFNTGCPTSYRIVIGSKLRFSRLIEKLKENESFKKIFKAFVKNFLQKMLGFSSIMCVFLSLKCRDNPIWYGTLCSLKYQRSTTSGCKDIVTIKSECVWAWQRFNSYCKFVNKLP